MDAESILHHRYFAHCWWPPTGRLGDCELEERMPTQGLIANCICHDALVSQQGCIPGCLPSLLQGVRCKDLLHMLR